MGEWSGRATGLEALRVAVVVSSDRSDLFFLNRIARRLPVVGAVVDRSGLESSSATSVWSRLSLLRHPRRFVEKVANHWFWVRHHARTRAIDRTYFGDDGHRVDPAIEDRVQWLDPGEPLNGPRAVAWLRSREPDVLLTCGCGMLRGDLLAVAPLGALNLHGGLSQRYRGLWTTLWAVHNEEPEWVGYTVHFVGTGVDDGAVVAQGRPTIEPGDDPESLYAKVVCQGVETMIACVEQLARGQLPCHTLERLGPVYLGGSVTRDVIRRAWRTARAGAIEQYLADQERRDAPVRDVLVRGPGS